MADLGSWLTGAYKISSPLSEEDLDESGTPQAAREPEGQQDQIDPIEQVDRGRRGKKKVN